MHPSGAVTVKITYERPGTIPPIFVAGSFTEPPWEAIELDHDNHHGQFTFSKSFDMRPGKYQYKFRLGHGDWWVCNDQCEIGLFRCLVSLWLFLIPLVKYLLESVSWSLLTRHQRATRVAT